MQSLVNRLKGACESARLRRRARKDQTPRSALELCRFLVRSEDWEQALETATKWLERYPHSHELQDIVRRSFKMQLEERAYQLQYRILDDPSVAAYRDLIEHYIKYSELDEAVQVVEEMVRRYRRLSKSHYLRGMVYLRRFQRDHLAEDGAEALDSLQRACSQDTTGFDCRFALAEAYFHIGANAKSMWHLLLALEQEPDSRAALELRAQLEQLPASIAKIEHEKDLLVDVEENDRVRRGRTRERIPQAERDSVSRGVQQITMIPGVKQAVVSHKSYDLVADKGVAYRIREPGESRFVDFAHGFRKSASLALKRMGLGALQEAELDLIESHVLGYAADTSILMVETLPGMSPRAIEQDARDLLAVWTARKAS